MKIRMRTSRAGTAAATIIQGGKGRVLPRGGMNHVRLWGDVTESPVGTVSFCVAGRKTGFGDIASPHSSCSHPALCSQCQGSRKPRYEQVWGKLVFHLPESLQGLDTEQRMTSFLPEPQAHLSFGPQLHTCSRSLG